MFLRFHTFRKIKPPPRWDLKPMPPGYVSGYPAQPPMHILSYSIRPTSVAIHVLICMLTEIFIIIG